MISNTEMPPRALDARERIIVALDVATAAEARLIVDALKGAVGAFKIGLQLFTAAGPELVTRFVKDGNRIFLDLKFHDIPNTVARASVEAAKMGVWMFNLHASGGQLMMRQAVDAIGEVCSKDGLSRPLVIGVTVLTSSDEDTIREVGIVGNIGEQVIRLAKLAFDCGLDGVVASSQEVSIIREAISDRKFLTVTPGIRPTLATVDDQKRVTTLRQAVSNGSDYVVIGRPILEAEDRLAAVERLCGEIRP